MRLRLKKLKRKSKEPSSKKRAYAYFLRTYYERNKKTLWTACRAVIIGISVIIFGLMMTVLGYFDKDLSLQIFYNSTRNENITVINEVLRYPLKSMQYLGPVFMGFGSFLLIIACVITLESRDKHAQIIQDESNEIRKSKRQAMNKQKILNNEEMQENCLITDPSKLITNGSVKGTTNENLNKIYSKFRKNTGNIKYSNNHSIVYTHPSGENFINHDIESLIEEPENKTSNVCDSIEATNNHSIPISKSSMNKTPDFQPTILSTNKEKINSNFLIVNKLKPRGQAPIANFDSLSLIESVGNSPHLPQRNKTLIL